jgi:hypothetical protein
MATKVAVLRKKDPFAVVGEAMVAAADAVKKSTSDARYAASQAVPAVRSALAQGVYVVTYYTSFGAVFAALAVSRMTPMDNAFGYGIRDGAVAARDARSNSSGRPAKAAVRPTARKRTESRRSRPRPASKGAAPVVEVES